MKIPDISSITVFIQWLDGGLPVCARARACVYVCVLFKFQNKIVEPQGEFAGLKRS